jgi:hypothetical protein
MGLACKKPKNLTTTPDWVVTAFSPVPVLVPTANNRSQAEATASLICANIFVLWLVFNTLIYEEGKSLTS